MSIKKAQDIANVLDRELGFPLVEYTDNDLQFLKSKLEEFLELEVSTDELVDPADMDDELNELDDIGDLDEDSYF